jgi:hypothetical protein
MTSPRADVRIGVEAGLVAAVVSSVPGVVWVLTGGEPAWRPVQLIATLVGVDRLARFDPAAFVLGGVIHLAISAVLAVAFALAVPRMPDARTVAAGIAFGLIAYVVNFELTALVGLAEPVRDRTNDAVELAAHVLYGLVVATWIVVRRRRIARAAIRRG